MEKKLRGVKIGIKKRRNGQKNEVKNLMHNLFFSTFVKGNRLCSRLPNIFYKRFCLSKIEYLITCINVLHYNSIKTFFLSSFRAQIITHLIYLIFKFKVTIITCRS